MRKSFLYILTSLLIGLVACDKETEGLSETVVIPEFTLKGEPTIFIKQGETYTDPGVEAFVIEGETAVELKDVMSYVTVETDVLGSYSVNYAVTDMNGVVHHSTVSRNVIVIDPNDNITGFYMVDFALNGNPFFDKTLGIEVLIVGKGEGIFEISDWAGGIWHQQQGYGPNYAFKGNMGVNTETGVVTHVNSSDPWGGENYIEDGANYDKATGIITYSYVDTDVSYIYGVTLTKK